VKYSKSEIMNRAYKIPDLKFEDQNLTSFAGLIIFQPLVAWVLKGGIVIILDKIEKGAEVGIAGMFGGCLLPSVN
jgi:hypothetical protein